MAWVGKKQRADEEIRDQALAAVEASTLADTSRRFSTVRVIWGTARGTMQGAFEALLVEAYGLGCDAVLGVGFTSPAQRPGSTGGWSGAHFIAYGTGVKWVEDEPAEQPR